MDFQNRTAEKYKNILPEFEKMYASNIDLAFTRDYYSEVTSRNIELLRTVGITDRLVKAFDSNGEKGYDGFKARLTPFLEGFYKDYISNIDRDVFASLVKMYADNVDKKYQPATIVYANASNEIEALANKIYSSSIFVSQDK